MKFMEDQDPTSYALITYVWVILISSWGGIAGYVRKLKKGHVRFSIAELIGEICISGFVGIVTFFLCEASELNQILSAALIGISSHMGSRAILMMEKIGEKLFRRWLNQVED